MSKLITLTFLSRFKSDIVEGRKTSTIRKRGSAHAGDEVGCWYAGMRAQPINVFTVSSVDEIVMTNNGVKRNGVALSPTDIEILSTQDGFNSIDDFRAFFEQRYGFPFYGELISWK